MVRVLPRLGQCDAHHTDERCERYADARAKLTGIASEIPDLEIGLREILRKQSSIRHEHRDPELPWNKVEHVHLQHIARQRSADRDRPGERMTSRDPLHYLFRLPSVDPVERVAAHQADRVAAVDHEARQDRVVPRVLDRLAADLVRAAHRRRRSGRNASGNNSASVVTLRSPPVVARTTRSSGENSAST